MPQLQFSMVSKNAAVLLHCFFFGLNPLSANPTKWSDTLKQFVANLLMNCLSVFDHFVKLVLKGLTFMFKNF